MTKRIYYLLLLVLICIGTTFKFAHTHEEMPVGCDEFGYLNLAKHFDEGKLTDRSYLPELLTHLRASGITEPELSWMVTPHAYHVLPGTNKVINQYPPGTSYILSLLPYDWRNLLFPLLVMFSFILIPALALRFTRIKEWNLFDVLFPVLLFLVTVSSPFTTELSRVNSLAVTFGLLLAAGMVLIKKPFLACFLIALTVNFRIVNLLMLVPAILFLPLTAHLNKKENLQNFKMLFQAGILILLAIIPLLYYNYSLTGNPIASTYSVVDTAINGIEGVSSNILFYFNTNQHWFILHLIAILTIILFCYLKKISWTLVLKLIAFPLVNYIFFFWHKVTMDYYPYASAMILTGVICGLSVNLNFRNKFSLAIPTVGIALAFVVLISGYRKFHKNEHLTFNDAKAKYASLCNYDIVWGDLLSGTTEYVCGNNGFRYTVTTPRARIRAIRFLHDKNFKQVILLDDVPLKSELIIEELKTEGILFIEKNDRRSGRLLEITGNDSKNPNL